MKTRPVSPNTSADAQGCIARRSNSSPYASMSTNGKRKKAVKAKAARSDHFSAKCAAVWRIPHAPRTAQLERPRREHLVRSVHRAAGDLQSLHSLDRAHPGSQPLVSAPPQAVIVDLFCIAEDTRRVVES